MAEIPTLPPKKDVARALLLRGTVFVHLDPRKQGVTVPPWLRDYPQLVLQVGLDMPIPIPDLRIDDEGVYGTLSFSRQPFTCVVPWDAVFAMSGDDGKGMVWPDSMPKEIATEVNFEARRAGLVSVPQLPEGEDNAAPTPSARPRPALASVDGARPKLSLEPPPKDVTPAAQPLRLQSATSDGHKPSIKPRGSSKLKKLPPYLRVVK